MVLRGEQRHLACGLKTIGCSGKDPLKLEKMTYLNIEVTTVKHSISDAGGK